MSIYYFNNEKRYVGVIKQIDEEFVIENNFIDKLPTVALNEEIFHTYYNISGELITTLRDLIKIAKHIKEPIVLRNVILSRSFVAYYETEDEKNKILSQRVVPQGKRKKVKTFPSDLLHGIVKCVNKKGDFKSLYCINKEINEVARSDANSNVVFEVQPTELSDNLRIDFVKNLKIVYIILYL